MYSPLVRSVRTRLPHGLKPAWSSSTVPLKTLKPLSVVIRCPGTDANGVKSDSENSWKRKRLFTAGSPDPKRYAMFSIIQTCSPRRGSDGNIGKENMATDTSSAPIPAKAPAWAAAIGRVNDYVLNDLGGGPRPWKLAWVINFQKLGR